MTDDPLLEPPRSYYSEGLLEELCEENRKKLAQDPDNHTLRCNLANVLFQLGRYEDAIQHYEICVQNSPNNAEYHNNLGKTLLNAGRYEQAIASFEQVVARQPWPDAYFNMAVAFRSKGDLIKADELLLMAVSLNPRYREAINERGLILEALGRKDDALIEFKKVIALFFSEFQSQSADSYDYDVAVLFNNQDLVEETIRQLRRYVQKHPGFADGYYKLGQALEAKGLKNEAMLAFRRALEINPRYEIARKCFWKR